ncbi:hypothetical protein Csp1_06710 [Corynebacterium provencense]|uniref:Uncharacterized protein n=1 Tax=Corynebacterium provencense TaxID=1737425 RepID=A0A2Z3YVN7_9CORY|nr:MULTISPECIES: hypothetical protein [Corynebacterium]AWT25483.1 hypothetical protein Csp1_06710 [Corynebacterium provencense]
MDRMYVDSDRGRRAVAAAADAVALRLAEAGGRSPDIPPGVFGTGLAERQATVFAAVGAVQEERRRLLALLGRMLESVDRSLAQVSAADDASSAAVAASGRGGGGLR